MMKYKLAAFSFLTALFISAFSMHTNAQTTNSYAEDFHSYSNPQQIRVKNVDLDWTVLFDKKILQGTATLTVERAADANNAPLILDTRDLKIARAETSADGKTFKKTTFKLGAADKFLGSPLTVQLPANAKFVRIAYVDQSAGFGFAVARAGADGGQEIAVYVFAGAGNSRAFVYSDSGFTASSRDVFGAR